MRKRRLSMRFEDWPPQDRDLWIRAFRSGDIFDDRGVAANWRPKTVAQAQYAYSRWLQHLYDLHHSTLNTAAADRVTVDRVREFVAHEAKRISAVSIGALLGHLVLALRATAPNGDWQWLTQIQRRQLATCKVRDKRASMVPVHELVELGYRLMASAQSDGTVNDIVAYRDGLMIAMLASRPLRRKNFAEIRLNKHIMVAREHIRVAFDAQEMKGGRPFECSMPVSLVPAFRRYMTDVRPAFPGTNGHDYLWCSMKSGPLGSDGIYQAIVKRSVEAFGKPVHPHLFRDIAATAIAIDRPDQSLLARDLLAHSSFKTTQGHYLHAESMKAGTRYVALLESRRCRTGKR